MDHLLRIAYLAFTLLPCTTTPTPTPSENYMELSCGNNITHALSSEAWYGEGGRTIVIDYHGGRLEYPSTCGAVEFNTK